MKAASGFRLAAALALAALLALAGARLYAALFSMSQPHLGKEDCAGCHLAGKNVTAEEASKLVGAQETLCLKCHPKTTQVSHPSGFTPKAPLPAAWPTDWKGDLTCSTCHEIHSAKKGLMRGDKRGKEFCLACHDSRFFEKMRDGGASMESGHFRPGMDPLAPNMDIYTQQCMSCHAKMNTNKGTRVDKSGVVRHASRSISHPLGVSYQEAMREGGYRPMHRLPKKILLPDGKMSCVSCHTGYSQEHGKLLTPKARSALCYECHDL